MSGPAAFSRVSSMRVVPRMVRTWDDIGPGRPKAGPPEGERAFARQGLVSCRVWAGFPQAGLPATRGGQSMEIFRRRLKSFSIFPVPSTTEARDRRPWNGEARLLPEPLVQVLEEGAASVRTIPLSTMSADSSGGVCSSATRTASMMLETVSDRASRISSSRSPGSWESPPPGRAP